MNAPAPIPQGNYVPAQRFGAIVYTAGMTPRLSGKLILSGKVKADGALEVYLDAVRLAAGNALTAAEGMLADGERIAKIISMTVYVNAEEGFTLHSKLADFASDYLHERLGDAGIGSRTAVGVASLPGDAPVEIQIVAGVE